MKLRIITVSKDEQRIETEKLLAKMGIVFSTHTVVYGEWEITFYAKKKVWKKVKKNLILEKLEMFVMF